MAYQITLSEQDYAALAAAAVRNGTAPEQLLHDLEQRRPLENRRGEVVVVDVLHIVDAARHAPRPDRGCRLRVPHAGLQRSAGRQLGAERSAANLGKDRGAIMLEDKCVYSAWNTA